MNKTKANISDSKENFEHPKEVRPMPTKETKSKTKDKEVWRPIKIAEKERSDVIAVSHMHKQEPLCI